MALEIKDAVIGTLSIATVALLISFVGPNLTQDQLDKLYFCEAENIVRECISLSKYGVEDAKCTYLDESLVEKGDICTLDGIRYAWKPVSNYLEVTDTKISPTVTISSIQNCMISFYNESYTEDYDCEQVTLKNATVVTQCLSREVIVQHNNTICDEMGYKVNASGIIYDIKKLDNSCCGLRQTDLGYEITCKELVNGICNPVCQQTNKNDLTDYDEFCMIYTVTPKGLTKKMVGSYNYVLNNQIVLSSVKETKILPTLLVAEK